MVCSKPEWRVPLAHHLPVYIQPQIWQYDIKTVWIKKKITVTEVYVENETNIPRTFRVRVYVLGLILGITLLTMSSPVTAAKAFSPEDKVLVIGKKMI